MNVPVQLFAAAKQIAGIDLVTLELSDEATLAELRVALLNRYPELGPLQGHLRFSINAEYASDAHAIREGDEIACIPPVSGG